MYPEFIAIYIGLGILALMLAAVIVMQIVLLRREHGTKQLPTKYPTANNLSNTGSIVFCKSCATQFDASQKVCPHCGTPR